MRSNAHFTGHRCGVGGVLREARGDRVRDQGNAERRDANEGPRGRATGAAKWGWGNRRAAMGMGGGGGGGGGDRECGGA